MLTPGQVDNSMISNTVLYRAIVNGEEAYVNQILKLKTPLMESIVQRLSVIVIAAMSGTIKDKALGIISDKIFLSNLFKGQLNGSRITDLLKFELDSRVDTSFETRSLYKYVSDEEYQGVIIDLKNQVEHLKSVNENLEVENLSLLTEKENELDKQRKTISELHEMNMYFQDQMAEKDDLINKRDIMIEELKYDSEYAYSEVKDLSKKLNEALAKIKVLENQGLPPLHPKVQNTRKEENESIVKSTHEGYVSDVNHRLISIINDINARK